MPIIFLYFSVYYCIAGDLLLYFFIIKVCVYCLLRDVCF